MAAVQNQLEGLRLEDLDAPAMRIAKQYGFSDAQIAHLTGTKEVIVRAYRKGLGVVPTFKTVDTCAAEFAAKPNTTTKTYETPHVAAAGAAPSFGDSEIVPVGQAQSHDFGRRSQPHWPGY